MLAGGNFSSADTRPDIFPGCSAQRQDGARWEVRVCHFPLPEAARAVTCLPPSEDISTATENASTPIIQHSSDNEVATNHFSNFPFYKKSPCWLWGGTEQLLQLAEKNRTRGKGCVLQRLFKLTRFKRSQNTTAWTCNTSEKKNELSDCSQLCTATHIPPATNTLCSTSQGVLWGFLIHWHPYNHAPIKLVLEVVQDHRSRECGGLNKLVGRRRICLQAIFPAPLLHHLQALKYLVWCCITDRFPHLIPYS